MGEDIEFSPFTKLVYLLEILPAKLVDTVLGIFIIVYEAEILGIRKLMYRTENKVKTWIGCYLFCDLNILKSLSQLSPQIRFSFPSYFSFSLVTAETEFS